MGYVSIHLKHFDIRNLVKISVPGDGSCLFNSIMMGLSKTYKDSNPCNRARMVIKLRYTLSTILEQTYHILANGEWPTLCKSFPELELDYMKRELMSNLPVSGIYNELITKELEVDMYIIDLHTGDLYLTGGESRNNIGRRTIFIGYMRGYGTSSVGHWDLLGIYDSRDQSIHTVFDTDHLFVRMAKERINVLTK